MLRIILKLLKKLKNKIPLQLKGIRFIFGARGGNRTHMAKGHTILSRARLPIPPHKQQKYYSINIYKIKIFYAINR